MTRTNTFLAILIGAVVLIGATCVIARTGSHGGFGRANGWYTYGDSGGHLTGSHDHGDRFCADGGSGGIESLIAYGKSEVAPREQQAAAWDRLADALRKTAGDFAELCGAMRDQATATPLATLEAAMDRMQRAIETVRPPLDALYKTLAPDQQRKLDALIAYHWS
jgi:hypothetical protein